jgi:hypothetical protein
MRVPQVVGLLLVEFNFVNPVFAGSFEMKFRNHEIFNKIHNIGLLIDRMY